MDMDVHAKHTGRFASPTEWYMYGEQMELSRPLQEYADAAVLVQITDDTAVSSEAVSRKDNESEEANGR